MLDVSVPGEIFAAPGPPRLIEALRLANRKAGVLLVVLNHAGDVLSANFAMQMVKKENLNVKQVLTHEDISVPSRQDPKDRRGLIGCFPVIKVAGAAAEKGYSLDQCLAVAERMERNMATLAVAISGATHPCTGEVIAELPEGRWLSAWASTARPAAANAAGFGGPYGRDHDRMLVKDLSVQAGEEMLVMINGVGSTTLMEMIWSCGGSSRSSGKRIKLARSVVGEFLTAQEMGGFQMFAAGWTGNARTVGCPVRQPGLHRR
jgi:dihydroxyacetone kinase-like protein